MPLHQWTLNDWIALSMSHLDTLLRGVWEEVLLAGGRPRCLQRYLVVVGSYEAEGPIDPQSLHRDLLP